MRNQAYFLSVFLLVAFKGWSQPADWFEQPIFPSAASDLNNVDVRLLLQTACAGKVYFGGGRDRKENGCLTCPPGSGDPDYLGGVALRSVTFGHFVSGASEDAVLGVAGCEPHSHHWGGSFLLTKQAGIWRLQGYQNSLITEQCHKLSTVSGRELLLCSYYFGGQGSMSRSLYLLDFAVPGKPVVKPLLTVWNDMRACRTPAVNKPVLQSVIESVRFPDLNGDHVPDVSILARTGKVQRSDAEYKACESWSNNGAWPLPPVSTPAFRIDYLLQGDHLVLTPASVPVMKHFPHSDLF